MSNPMLVLKLSGIVQKKSKGTVGGCICEMVCKVFTTRNLLHFAHWNTKSFAKHLALGDLYDDIIEDVDDIVESYQGKFGLLKDLYTEKAEVPDDIVKHVEDEANWIEENRCFISKGDSAIESLIDVLLSHYYRVIYKLKNLS